MPDKPVVHGRDHRPGGLDPTYAGAWHLVAASADTAWSSGTNYVAGNTVSHTDFNFVCQVANGPGSTVVEPEVYGVSPPGNNMWFNYWTLTVPFFQNGWANSGGTYAPMRFRLITGDSAIGRDIDAGQTAIEIQGSVTGGSGTIFTLPDGCRPDSDLHLAACDDTGAFTVFTVQAGGDVIDGFV